MRNIVGQRGDSVARRKLRFSAGDYLAAMMLFLGIGLGLATFFKDFGFAGNILAELSGGLVTFGAVWLFVDRERRRRTLVLKRRRLKSIGTLVARFGLVFDMSLGDSGVQLKPLLRARERREDVPACLREIAAATDGRDMTGCSQLFSEAPSLVEDAKSIADAAADVLDGLDDFSEATDAEEAVDRLETATTEFRGAVYLQTLPADHSIAAEAAAMIRAVADVYETLLPIWT